MQPIPRLFAASQMSNETSNLMSQCISSSCILSCDQSLFPINIEGEKLLQSFILAIKISIQYHEVKYYNTLKLYSFFPLPLVLALGNWYLQLRECKDEKRKQRSWNKIRNNKQTACKGNNKIKPETQVEFKGHNWTPLRKWADKALWAQLYTDASQLNTTH